MRAACEAGLFLTTTADRDEELERACARDREPDSSEDEMPEVEALPATPRSTTRRVRRLSSEVRQCRRFKKNAT